jgi:HKD family nuclease
MTNARNEPTRAAELRAELASADHVDLLCVFVKWQGLRLLEEPLSELRQRNVPLRVITTTYLDATNARALDVEVMLRRRSAVNLDSVESVYVAPWSADSTGLPTRDLWAA